MNEKLIEKKLRLGVKKRGGIAFKFVSPGTVGVPDRIVLMPNGKQWFVETKSTGKKLSPVQKIVVNRIRELGHNVWVIDDRATLEKFFAEIIK